MSYRTQSCFSNPLASFIALRIQSVQALLSESRRKRAANRSPPPTLAHLFFRDGHELGNGNVITGLRARINYYVLDGRYSGYRAQHATT